MGVVVHATKDTRAAAVFDPMTQPSTSRLAFPLVVFPVSAFKTMMNFQVIT